MLAYIKYLISRMPFIQLNSIHHAVLEKSRDDAPKMLRRFDLIAVTVPETFYIMSHLGHSSKILNLLVRYCPKLFHVQVTSVGSKVLDTKSFK